MPGDANPSVLAEPINVTSNGSIAPIQHTTPAAILPSTRTSTIIAISTIRVMIAEISPSEKTSSAPLISRIKAEKNGSTKNSSSARPHKPRATHFIQLLFMILYPFHIPAGSGRCLPIAVAHILALILILGFVLVLRLILVRILFLVSVLVLFRVLVLIRVLVGILVRVLIGILVLSGILILPGILIPPWVLVLILILVLILVLIIVVPASLAVAIVLPSANSIRRSTHEAENRSQDSEYRRQNQTNTN